MISDPNKIIPPKFVVGERTIIGYLLAHPDRLNDVRGLTVDYFTDDICKAAFQCVMDNPGADTGILLQHIERNTGNKDIIVHLQDFLRLLSGGVDITEYVERVKDMFHRRTALEMIEKAKGDLLNESITSTESLSGLISSLSAPEMKSDYLIDAESIVERRLQGLQDRKNTGRVPTGYPTLDEYISEGFAPGVSIIAARPNMGKTTFKRNLIAQLCDNGYGILNVVPEMGFDREQDGFDSMRTGEFIYRFYNLEDWEGKGQISSLMDAAKQSSEFMRDNWNYYVNDDPFVSFKDVERDITQIRMNRPLHIVFIDLFDRLHEVSNAKFDKHEVIKRLLQRQAALAKKWNIHFCNVVQIRRPQIQGKTIDYRPTVEMLKDSGAFEEVADLIFLLYREGRYFNVSDDVLEVIIAKQRTGVGNKSVWMKAEWKSLMILDDPEIHRTYAADNVMPDKPSKPKPKEREPGT